MGLSIAYQLRLPARITAGEVYALLKRVAEQARSLGCPAVRGPLSPAPENQLGYRIINVPGSHPMWARPDGGWLVSADIGDQCESLDLGLFVHPSHLRHNYIGLVKTKLPTNWHYDGWCKTGYAANVGWEHFLACHQRVLALLRFLRRQGVKVSIQDEGGYYPRKDETGLRRWMGLPVPPATPPPSPRPKRKPQPQALAQPAIAPTTPLDRQNCRFKAGRFNPAEQLLQDGFPLSP